MAVAGQALRQALPHRDPLSVNAFYLAPTVLGSIDCEVQVLRTGGSTSFATVRMSQQGELKVQVTAAYTVFGLQKWVPTVELTVQVRAHPAPGPLQARFYSRHLTRGVIEEDGEFWDSAGKLVCISRQTAELRVAS